MYSRIPGLVERASGLMDVPSGKEGQPIHSDLSDGDIPFKGLKFLSAD